MKITIIFGIIFCAISITGCNQNQTINDTQLANPSAVYCQDQGFTYQITTQPDGSQSGICILPNGKQCEAWSFYRGECQP